jgi:nucleoside-diphosphate kinase
MHIEKTCAIIKPDAVASGLTGLIIELIERSGFTIAHMEKKHLTVREAEGFYAVHKARSFFGELVEFMTSGPSVIMVLERPDAVAAWRELMGATNPAEARVGTLRNLFGTDIGKNATHGSDSLETAAYETAYFFPPEKK